MFETGQWVLYGVHGVCRVIGTEKQLVNRKRTEYLVLEPLSRNESRFYLPTGNPTAMAKLKAVLSAGELQALLSSDEIRENVWIADENQRKQTYRELISSGDRVMLLKMVTTLYVYREAQAAAGRKFHLCDDNFLRDAEKLLSSEIALVLDKTPEEARAYLQEQLK
ncbi:MAG: hypothetical protein J6B95_03495 [Oscillospiraceae bacterium]|nr:hypothetical protein [Oscillospiraceae bacterium]